jgi:type II secretory pathway pseudopilin PulG
MKTSQKRGIAAFTLSEMLIAVGIGSLILAAITLTSVSLQKSLSAVDNYFATHNQQIRIIDYMGRDVRRSTIVNTSVDLQTVNCYIPNYIIQAGDPDAGAGGSNVGKRRTPTITSSLNKFIVNYGTVDYTQSPPSGVSKVVYSVSGQSIIRTENGAVTTIASSTDQLVPKTTDVQLANTEYATTVVTFLPTFVFGPSPTPTPSPAPPNARRDGTTVYSTAYLRNLRRGN